ncbi:peptidyl-prolyl cis-trans isomerase [Litorimonas sp. RW-G-Af-16]|uniref:peptidylprolyl isomerase n=1 Tax=Litorimonas sp. RW-G-Af-16 TaxID=3241168 RepID=UPI00390C41A0
MTKFWQEPLVHFILLGAALFLGHSLWASHIAKTDYTITVDPAEIERQAAIFASENRRDLTDEDLEGLLFAYVEEQALMREAQRLGLDDDDTIIRRRLAQKMRFMISDVGAPPLPKEATLREWFELNKSDFITPETRSFRHIYISPNRSQDADLNEVIVMTINQLDEMDWREIGDPFMLPREYSNTTEVKITRDFGRDFAAQVFALPSGTWSDPVESALGVHLVYIDTITPAVQPAFDDIRIKVEEAWLDQATRQNNQDRLEKLITKYKVVVEE